MAVEFERIRQTGRERLQKLSKPKEPKVEWWTNVGPNVMWGTQEMLWPIPKGAKEAEASNRVTELASPKKTHQTGLHAGRPIFYYSCGRPSMIWEAKPSTAQEPSTRLSELATPKRMHQEYKEDKDLLESKDVKNLNPKDSSTGWELNNPLDRRQYFYSCGRSSPIWQVQKAAKSAGDRPRTQQLAEPRPPHKEFQPSRQVETIIPTPALSASASERVQTLSTPKERPWGPFRPPAWPVSTAAKNATSTNRCSDLARPKGTVEGYQLPRDEMWPVSRGAKRANATGRLQELSLPVVRASMDHVQFNPDAFLVKESALKGVVPRRVEELAQPIQR